MTGERPDDDRRKVAAGPLARSGMTAPILRPRRARPQPLDDLALLLDELERDVARLDEADEPIAALACVVDRAMDLLRAFACARRAA